MMDETSIFCVDIYAAVLYKPVVWGTILEWRVSV